MLLSSETSKFSVGDTGGKDFLTEDVNYSERDSQSLSFLWLEITRKCNLYCVHCYANSSPHLEHGQMSLNRWKEIMTEASQLGVRNIQFIGGEPTIHPNFVNLIQHAVKLGFSIEVFSNLIHVTENLWDLFQASNISIATSFYSLHPSVHNKITHHKQSQKNTLDSIKEALKRGLQTRVGIIEISPDQDVTATENMLRDLGVKRLGKDRVRQIGRGLEQTGGADYSIDELCGKCGLLNAAVDPDGNVYPCVFSRWLNVGNVQKLSLREVILGENMSEIKAKLNRRFEARWNNTPRFDEHSSLHSFSQVCNPRSCRPVQPCSPDDQNDCSPDTYCRPTNCNPNAEPPPCSPREDCRPSCFPGEGGD